MIRFGAPVYRFDSLASTMETLDRLARAGTPEGAAVITRHQTNGVGRAGRRWETSPDDAFLCSVLLRPALPARNLSALPLFAGLAIAEAVEMASGLRTQLKWPNDVYLNGRKVSGVLIQSRTLGDEVEFVNLGFGVNLNSRPEELPETATSIGIETGLTIDLAEFETIVFDRLSRRYEEFRLSDGFPSLQPWLDRAMLFGEQVEIQQEFETIYGFFIGVFPDGSLELETAYGTQRVAMGEMTRGPRARMETLF